MMMTNKNFRRAQARFLRAQTGLPLPVAAALAHQFERMSGGWAWTALQAAVEWNDSPSAAKKAAAEAIVIRPARGPLKAWTYWIVGPKAAFNAGEIIEEAY